MIAQMDFHAGDIFVVPECQGTTVCSKGSATLLIAIEQHCRTCAADNGFLSFWHHERSLTPTLGVIVVVPECQETTVCSNGFDMLLIAIEQHCRTYAVDNCFLIFQH